MRPLPRVGAPVTVVFLAARVAGVIESIHDDGRRLVVLTADEKLLEFALSPATGRFKAGGRLDGARLLFDEPPIV